MKYSNNQIKLRTEPLGVMPDGSLALCAIIDIHYQLPAKIHNISIKVNTK